MMELGQSTSIERRVADLIATEPGFDIAASHSRSGRFCEIELDLLGAHRCFDRTTYDQCGAFFQLTEVLIAHRPIFSTYRDFADRNEFELLAALLPRGLEYGRTALESRSAFCCRRIGKFHDRFFAIEVI
jgi:hypothetical protein